MTARVCKQGVLVLIYKKQDLFSLTSVVTSMSRKAEFELAHGLISIDDYDRICQRLNNTHVWLNCDLTQYKLDRIKRRFKLDNVCLFINNTEEHTRQYVYHGWFVTTRLLDNFINWIDRKCELDLTN